MLKFIKYIVAFSPSFKTSVQRCYIVASTCMTSWNWHHSSVLVNCNLHLFIEQQKYISKACLKLGSADRLQDGIKLGRKHNVALDLELSGHVCLLSI